MVTNYLKIAFRNIIRNKGYSFINIAGLAIGICCCILILLYVQDELSYDRQYEKANRTYRVFIRGVLAGGAEMNMAITTAPLAHTLLQEYPEVEQVTRFRNFGFPVVRYQDKVFSEERFFWADSTFFEVFTLKFLRGNPKTALTQPNTVVLTRSTAEKYFGEEDPIGKSLNTDNRRDYLVTGVVEDVPHNSHLHFDFLGSLASYDDSRNPFWLSNNYYTYLVLRQGESPEELEGKLDDVVRKYVGPALLQIAGINYDQMVEAGGSYGFFLQPLTAIHLYSDLDYEIEPNGDARYVTIFAVIALAILLIACVNFMNLATARSSSRAREVGIRKTVGSSRMQLVRQFLAETIFMSMLAVALAALLVEFVLPLFNALTRKNLDIHYFDNITTLPVLLGLALLVGLVAGSYPAFFLAAFKPIAVLKASPLGSGASRSSFLRTGLVVSQFAISIVLITGTLVVHKQLQYIQNKKLGFNKEQILVVQKTDDIGERVHGFVHELRQHASVVNVSNSTHLFGKPFNSNAHLMAGASGEETHILWEMSVDYDFLDTYEIEMADGRFLSREFLTDSSAIVINETAVKAFGLTDPVGKVLVQLGRTQDEAKNHTIIGVMKDVHFESLHQRIRPMSVKLFRRGMLGRYVSVRLTSGNIGNTRALIEETWHKFAGPQAFESVFFDQDFARLYDNEKTTGRVLTVFAALAIFIACLGLLGLASFTAEQRTKEIGIRKVLGASVPNVVFLLSREFAKWVLAASVLAWPVAWYMLNGWLDNFAYRTMLEPANFVLAGLAALVIALLTVSYQTIRVAIANPVKALRCE